MKILPASEMDVPALPCALQQSPGYARALLEMGADVQCHVACVDQTPIGRFQVVSRKMGPVTLRWLPRGPVWQDTTARDDRLSALIHLTQSFSPTGTWIIAPDRDDDVANLRMTPIISAQHVAEIDLTTPSDLRLARQHGKWRNRLRQAQRAGLRVVHRPLDTSRDGTVVIREARQQKQRRYKALPPAFLLAWMKANPKAHRLFMVQKDGTTLAHMLILLHHPAATYHIGWSGPEGRQVSAHNLVLWEASNWLARRGYQRLDLGAVDTQNAPGLARFKIGSGALIRALGATGLYLPRPAFARRNRHAAA